MGKSIKLMEIGKLVNPRAAACALAAAIAVAGPMAPKAALSATAAPVRMLPPAGPYAVSMETDPTLPDHVVYRPIGVSRRMPIVAWGNGGCAAVGNRYRRFLSDIASRGILVVAVGNIGDARYETDHDAEPFMPKGPPVFDGPGLTDSKNLVEAIDWANTENRRDQSRYFRRLDTRHIAVMGHSCGGLQALAVATSDPRVTTAVILNSGVWTVGPGGLPGARITKSDLARLNVPIAYLSGDASDGAHANTKDDFGRLPPVPAIWAYRAGVGHTAQYWEPSMTDEYSRVAGAWLAWQLLGSRKGQAVFSGRDCVLCRDSDWTFARRSIR